MKKITLFFVLILLWGSSIMAQTRDVPDESLYCLKIDVVKGNTIKMNFKGSGKAWVVKGDFDHIEVENLGSSVGWDDLEEYTVTGDEPWIKIYAENLRGILIRDNGNDGDILGADFSEIPDELAWIAVLHSGYITSCAYNKMFHSLPPQISSGNKKFFVSYNGYITEGAEHSATDIASGKGWTVYKHTDGPIVFQGDGTGCQPVLYNCDCSGAISIPYGGYGEFTHYTNTQSTAGYVNNGFIQYEDYGGPDNEGMVNGLWYEFTPLESGTYLIYSDYYYGGEPDYYIDSEISLFANFCGGLLYQAHSDNEHDDGYYGETGTEIIEAQLNGGEVYHINVGSHDNDVYDNYDMPSKWTMYVVRKYTPNNDACENAYEIDPEGLPYSTTQFDAYGATNNNGFIPITGDDQGDQGMNDGVWYKFTPKYTGRYELEVENEGLVFGMGTEVGVFSGSPSNLTYVTNKRPTYYGNPGSFYADLEADITYYINIASQSATEDKTEYPFNLKLDIAVPANDKIDNAIAIDPASLPYSITQDASKATNNSGSWSNNDGSINDGVWYSFTPTETASYEFSAVVEENSFDPIAVGIVNDISNTEHYVDDFDVYQGTAEETWFLEAGHTYGINIANGSVENEPEGIFTLSVKKSTPPASLFPITMTVEPNSEVTMDIEETYGYVWIEISEGNFYKHLTSYIAEFPTFENTIKIYGSQITELDCSNNENKITGITFNDEQPNLKKINCSNNSIDNLVLTNAPNIEELNCMKNNLSSLNISNLEALKALNCSENNFSTEVIDALYCGLPDRSGSDKGTLYIANTTADANHADILTSSAQNARGNNWEVWYYGNETGALHNTNVPTTGTYVCGMVSVTNIAIDSTSITLKEGDERQLIVTFEPVTASNQNVTWSSDNDNIASVSPSGLVKAENKGTTQITVTAEDGGHTASCEVIVVDKIIGTKDMQEVNLVMYPNPVDNILFVDVPLSDFEIEIYSIYGEQLIRTENTREINLSSLMAGAYIVKVCTDNKVIIKKIIKK